MRSESEGRFFNVAVIGGGPGGNGPFVAADRLGAESRGEFLERGVVLIDAGSAENLGQGRLSQYDINSNSGGGDFLEAIDPNGMYKGILAGSSGRALTTAGNRTVHLSSVAAPFLGELGQQTARILGDSSRSDILTQTPVRRIDQHGDDEGAFYTLTSPSGLQVIARNVVLAAGAYEEQREDLPKLGEVVLSGDIINGKETARVGEILGKGGKVVFAGASHNTFAAALKLLREHDIQHEDAITIVHRGPIRRFFPGEKEAIAAQYVYEAGDICEQTRRVHRYGGVRGAPGELAERVVKGDESRISLFPVNADIKEAEEVLRSADMIVQGLGYHANVLPVYANGVNIGPRIDERGQVDVTSLARVRGHDGVELPNVFAVGLGHGILPSPEIGGEANFKGRVDSVNMFHGPVGERIIVQLLNS